MKTISAFDEHQVSSNYFNFYIAFDFLQEKINAMGVCFVLTTKCTALNESSNSFPKFMPYKKNSCLRQPITKYEHMLGSLIGCLEDA